MCAACISTRPTTPLCGRSTKRPRSRPRRGSTRPSQPCPGIPERREFEYERNGTVVLFAGLNVHDGGVAGWVTDSTCSDNFVTFLWDLIDQTPAHLDLHCIVDNLAAHQTDKVATLLEHNPGSICTSRPRTPPGSTRSSCSSPFSSVACYAAASSPPSMTSPGGSSPSSRTTTAGRHRSAGPTRAAPSRSRKSQ